jgi:glycosyltransferase involved in cell wall biosynthesis
MKRKSSMLKNEHGYKVSQKRFIIGTHVYGTGASQDLLRYFIEQKAETVLFIGHPLFYDPHLKGSGFELYRQGTNIRTYYTPHRNIPLFLGFLLHSVKTIWWSITNGPKWDVYIGSNNLNAFVGILLKKFGFVSRVVYYVIDYNPVRYSNPLINRGYHWLDKYCVLHSDETWNLSPRMEEGRIRYFHFSGGLQKVVPVGIWPESMNRVPDSKIHRHTAVFLGHMLKKQGMQHLVTAIPEIKKRIPDFHLLVLGGGDYLNSLRKQAHRLRIAHQIEFTGYIQNHRVIEKRLASCAIGIALYDAFDNGKLNYSYFGSPTKVKAYLAAGLPVLMTNVPYNAPEMVRAGCGIIATSNPEDIGVKLVSVLSRPALLRHMHLKVRQYRKQFNWNVIFARALKDLL